jgi:hypothetical protein
LKKAKGDIFKIIVGLYQNFSNYSPGLKMASSDETKRTQAGDSLDVLQHFTKVE